MLRKETDIIHLAMGGSKKFLHLLRGVQKVLVASKGGSKKFDDENFQLPSPPHQSIYEHSPIKSKMADAKKQCFFAFSVLN